MTLLVIALTTLLMAVLTLFSGFGLGTALVPVFALFFPLPYAIAAVAVIHLFNNVLKLSLMAKQANWQIVWRFGLPAIFAAIVGAILLSFLDKLPPLFVYTLGNKLWLITPIKLVMGGLIIFFVLLELWPSYRHLAFSARWLPLGGIISGFFGGLSGNQGMFRSAFLIKLDLSKKSFIATGAAHAVLVDVARLLIYGGTNFTRHFLYAKQHLAPIVVGIMGALVGTLLGTILLPQVKLWAIRVIVSIMMIVVGTGLILGLI